MKIRACLPLLLLPAIVWAAPVPATPAAPAQKKQETSNWVFSLLPKSMQKDPRLEITVITEMTESGKRLPPPSREAPAYYELFSTGFQQLGHAPGNEKTLSQAEIERLLTRSLATNGYQPAKPPGQRPSIMIVYMWGSHNRLVEGDDENPTLSGQEVARNLLDRAALVGGEKFSQNLLDLFSQADDFASSQRQPPADPTTGVPSIQPILGPEQMEFFNPVYQFKLRSSKNEFLIDQTASDVYFVVASAYDYPSIADKHRMLLWRTRMTVAAPGVSQEQSLPTLVLSAAPYFGKDMPEAEILSKHTIREGTVEIGTPTVVEPNVPAPPAKK